MFMAAFVFYANVGLTYAGTKKGPGRHRKPLYKSVIFRAVSPISSLVGITTPFSQICCTIKNQYCSAVAISSSLYKITTANVKRIMMFIILNFTYYFMTKKYLIELI